MKRKFDETKDKEIIFALGITKDNGDEFGYDYGVFPTIEKAIESIENGGNPSDEFRIFKCKFAKRIKIKTKIESVKEGK